MKDPTWPEREAFIKKHKPNYTRKEFVKKLAESAGIGENYAEKLISPPGSTNYRPRLAYAIWRCWNLDFVTTQSGEVVPVDQLIEIAEKSWDQNTSVDGDEYDREMYSRGFIAGYHHPNKGE